MTITGGTVTSTGAGTTGAGIGTGERYRGGGVTVTITGGIVNATGGYSADGIGCAYNSTSFCNVIIEGGSVTAIGGAERYGIGGGAVTIKGGSVKATGGQDGKAAIAVQPIDGSGKDVFLAEIANESGDAVTIDDISWNPGVHSGENKLYAYLTAGTHKVVIGGTSADLTLEAPVKPTEVPYVGGENPTANALPVRSGTTVWSENSETGGWYVVNQNVTMAKRVEVEGNVNLILADGAKLETWYLGGIHVSEGNSLTIWAQSGGTGSLSACSNNLYQAGIGGNDREDAGTITNNGGNITAKGRLYAAGIGGGAEGGAGTIIINGGNIDANSVTSNANTGAPG